MATIRIAAALRVFTRGEEGCVVAGRTVLSAVQELAERYPQLRPKLLNAQGGLGSAVFICLGDQDIRMLREGETPVGEQSVLSIYPALAGG